MDLIIEKVDGQILQDMHAKFDSHVEVIKVIETVNQNWLQIVSKDHKNEIYSIVTWDFNNNMEQSMMQCKPCESDKVGYHVVKGMNMKMNYFYNQNYLTDLEYNIPIRQKNVDQNLDSLNVSYNKQLNMINEYFNQRKLDIINEKLLGVEKASVLFYPVNRMDLILWNSIILLGERPDLIQQSCSLNQCNLSFDGISLFHYFADNSEIIEFIHQKFYAEQQGGTLSVTDKTLPLQILNPDNQGKTAMFLAVQSQSPQSFECMVEMLSNFPD